MVADRERLRMVCLTARDLVESAGADSASLAFGGALVMYSRATGCRIVMGGGRSLRIPDDELDDHGLVLHPEIARAIGVPDAA